jgi:hypothetical protein
MHRRGGRGALRLAKHEESFTAHGKSRSSAARLQSSLGMDCAERRTLTRVRESIAEKRLREHWPGVLAVADLLLRNPSPPAEFVRETFAQATGG